MATVSVKEFLKGGNVNLVSPASSNYGLTEDKTGFFDRAKENVSESISSIKSTFSEAKKGNITPLEAGIRTVGDTISGAYGVVGAATEPIVKSVAESGAGQYILNSSVGKAGIKAIEGGVESYNAWKQKNPRAAENLEAVVNIASIFPAEKVVQGGAGIAKSGTKLAKNIATEGADIAGKNLIKSGERIQNVVLKPTSLDIKNGFKPENITKYGLTGPLNELLPNTTNKIKSFRTELSSIIGELKDTPTINLKDAVEKLKKGFSSGGLKNLGSKQSIDNTIAKIESELDDILPNWRNQTLTFSDAIDAKRAAGLNASFLHGQIKQGLTAEDKVWNNLYRILQKETENVAKKSGNSRFQEVNKSLSELIPIEQAVIKRIPVADRNNIISLPELISFVGGTIEPGAFTIGLVNKALRSGSVAKGLVKVGEKLKK